MKQAWGTPELLSTLRSLPCHQEARHRTRQRPHTSSSKLPQSVAQGPLYSMSLHGPLQDHCCELAPHSARSSLLAARCARLSCPAPPLLEGAPWRHSWSAAGCPRTASPESPPPPCLPVWLLLMPPSPSLLARDAGQRHIRCFPWQPQLLAVQGLLSTSMCASQQH